MELCMHLWNCDNPCSIEGSIEAYSIQEVVLSCHLLAQVLERFRYVLVNIELHDPRPPSQKTSPTASGRITVFYRT